MAEFEITFTTDDITLHGSLRLPAGADADAPVPAVLLLAGSGPTDRNGDSALLPGSIGTLEFLADLLEQHGFASLRYDKLGSGATGLGPYELEDIGDLGFSVFVDSAAAGLRFLAGRAAVDPDRVYAVGHSEGALIALALADRGAKVAGIGLLEPLAVRLLDLLTTQIDNQLTAVVDAGQLPVELADELRVALAGAVESLRDDATLSDDLPDPLRAAGLVPANARALAEEDALDPRELARRLPAGLPVVTSCSAKDIQLINSDVDALDAALAHTALTPVRMTTANHVLKEIGDAPSTGADYIEPLPWSTEFTTGFEAWLRNL
ncbi:alpha/beta hydrolase family protein [Rhodococcus sp. SGAir0479]|uniref:alpha/beta hydrolase family protein n=1 Tax=Rhodococcus sp. SGAir0479 TaxID=2567884 RepID=UPI0010CCF336|nr:alpha/beta fold hydrolase [Rhodococcus sp. SGAir0479]QCQ90060.1 alpha/beta fold hydrolase [Rhodococcus sp. SGAir0479]